MTRSSRFFPKTSLHRRVVAGGLTGVLLCAGLTACTPPNENASDDKVDTASEVATDGSVSFDNAVVRATEGDDDMASIFGTLVNHSDKDVEVTGFSSSADAQMNQIHEVVDGTMREMDEPLVVPAHGETTLEPGGTHFMLMELGHALEPGEDVDVTLETSAGEVKLDPIPVRTMGAGAEGYDDLEDSGQPGHSDHSEHSDHADHAGREGDTAESGSGHAHSHH
ncbi:copper chaperone PCu(A)C [Corynebacterium massiliense]|uniref:Copper chaperone PCu(A)C n=1 Tax=Corynebacterium massiliense DSM 45435 TaxID=1121364 RepID=A0ABY7U7S1_9CORY|nr:copper chaperone PCu(A)C [Corynebacterium massiliense]WCZ32634.1 hypothetical protein CMASS_05965 [Corynebacterium massiliense DSM 45435]